MKRSRNKKEAALATIEGNVLPGGNPTESMPEYVSENGSELIELRNLGGHSNKGRANGLSSSSDAVPSFVSMLIDLRDEHESSPGLGSDTMSNTLVLGGN